LEAAVIKFIIVGAGNRGLGCFAKGLLGFPNKGLPEFPRRATLSAFVDNNLTRASLSAKECKLPELPVFASVSQAQRQVHADWCIVTTPDFTHADVVVEALGAGLNVLVDKPLATSAWECDRILSAQRQAGKQLLVGHNMRYGDWAFRTAQLVRGGAIGKVLNVEAGEILDYSHGGDYFHRWHSDFARSAGLMNHKGCHQLDFICWVLDDEPAEVSAFGGRSFYRPRKGDHGPRCSQCRVGKACPHFFDMDKWDGVYRRIYAGAEGEDGYIRDLCVFSDRHTINDHETLNIRFAGGALCSFTMLAFSPREYVYFNFTGASGRLECGSNSTDGKPYLRLLHNDGKVELIDFQSDRGEHGHGGADVRLIADILGLPGSDPLQRAAPREARRAVLVADLASRSIAAGGRPMPASAAGKDYPPAPPRTAN
jgi:predicted dehydrogenase